VADGIGSSMKSSLDSVLRVLSKESLLGARGNSGVILAQFFDGFAGSLAKRTTITTKHLSQALTEGTKRAYRALKDPVEGTILTVMKATAEKARELKDHEDLNRAFRKIFKTATEAQDRTPELLPVLKEAGVVDAGGEGFVTILEGFLTSLQDRELDRRRTRRVQRADRTSELWDVTTQNRYCLEFVLRGEKIPVRPLRQRLGTMAESIIVAKSGDLVKVHLHTETPERALALGEEVGEVCHVKLDDMKEMHTQTLFPAKIGAVAVIHGEGFRKIFENLGVHRTVPGGDSMNPSVQQILHAILETPAKKVLVLPNDPNVHMAAKEAAKLCPKQVRVIPTRSIPEGVAAMVSYDPEGGLVSNHKAMAEAMKRVASGKVTVAVRDGAGDGFSFRTGNYIGLSGKKILARGGTPEECALRLVRKIKTEESQIAMIYFGADVAESKAEGLVKKVKTECPRLEVQLYSGGQSHYQYIIGLLS
jgi:DAK2 domain fusion protein YloV